MKLDQRQKGVAFALLAPLLYALKSVAIKSAPPIQVEQILLLRYLSDFLFLSPLFFKARKKFSSKKTPLHMLRAVIIVFSAYCSAYGIRNLALADAILLENTMPLFIPLVLWLWHRQKITLFSCFLLALGFFSVFFLLKPKLNILQIGSFASLATGLLSAVITVSIKSLSKTESPITIYFYFSVFSGTLALCLCVYSWEGMPMIAPPLWLPLVLNSLFGISFQYSIIKAYSLISPHIVGGCAYFGILFSTIFGWLLWQEPIEMFQVFGGGLLIVSGLLLIRENRLRILPEKEPLTPSSS